MPFPLLSQCRYPVQYRFLFDNKISINDRQLISNISLNLPYENRVLNLMWRKIFKLIFKALEAGSIRTEQIADF